jgi:hypothetical protein
MSTPTSVELPQAHLRLGTAGGWRAYLVIFIEGLLAFFASRGVRPQSRGATVFVLLCTLLAIWTLYQFLLDTEIILYRDRLVLRSMGYLRRPQSLPLSTIQSVDIGYPPALRIQLRNGNTVIVGPWGHYNPKRLALLEAFVAALRERLPSTDPPDVPS